MRQKVVFIGPINVGTNENLKKILENMGYLVITCGIFKNRLNFHNDINFNIRSGEPRIKKIIKAIKPMGQIFLRLNKIDIFHFKAGVSLLPWNLDLPILRILGKKIIMHFEGSDLRQLDRMQKDSVNKILAKEIGSSNYKSVLKRIKYGWIKEWTNKLVISTPDLIQFAPEAEFVPNFVFAPRRRKKTTPFIFKKTTKNKIYILHAPTNRKVKGTKFIIKAVKKLQKEKYPIEFLLLENIQHDDIFNYYQKTDIVIDQLLIGIYSVVAVEGMLFGKPVICYIRKDLRKYYPNDLPIIFANPDNIYEVLKDLITDKEKRQNIGKISQEYVKKYHTEDVAGQKWQKIYQTL